MSHQYSFVMILKNIQNTEGIFTHRIELVFALNIQRLLNKILLKRVIRISGISSIKKVETRGQIPDLTRREKFEKQILFVKERSRPFGETRYFGRGKRIESN